MLHYVLPYFPQTLNKFIESYIAKYGDVDNSHLKRNKFGEFNSNVILSKQGAAPLGRVQPWDILMIVGHGVSVNLSREARLLGSDPQPMPLDGRSQPHVGKDPVEGWQREVVGNGVMKFRATVNDVVNWLDGKLNRQHVLLKLLMCLGGGGFGPRMTDDNFAKLLAKYLYDKGYTNIAVGGYRGEVNAGIDTYFNQDRSIVKVDPLSKTVHEVGGSGSAAAKDNLDYYHGSGPDLICRPAIKLVKRTFREFGDLGNSNDRCRQIAAQTMAEARAFDGPSQAFVEQALRVVLQAESDLWHAQQPPAMAPPANTRQAPLRPNSPPKGGLLTPARPQFLPNFNNMPR